MINAEELAKKCGARVNVYEKHPAIDWYEMRIDQLQAFMDEAQRMVLEAERGDVRGRLWGSRHELQIDSYATGHPQAGMAYLIGNYVSVEITDGNYSWRGQIPLPVDWNK